MFILYAVALGLVIGVLVGGRISGLADIHFRWAPLVFVGFLFQIVLFHPDVASRIGSLGPPLYVLSTAIVVAAVLRNVDLPGMPLVLLGAASNLVAILANGGYMPASPSALAAVGEAAPVIYSNSSVVPNPAFEPLTDVFALPAWLPFNNVFSVGDVILGVGVVIVIVTAMRGGSRTHASTQPGDD
jgi:uncharacterized protein DUF5317